MHQITTHDTNSAAVRGGDARAFVADVDAFWAATAAALHAVKAYAHARASRERSAALARLRSWDRRAAAAMGRASFSAGETAAQIGHASFSLAFAAPAVVAVVAAFLLIIGAPPWRAGALGDPASAPPVPLGIPASHVAQLVAAGPLVSLS